MRTLKAKRHFKNMLGNCKIIDSTTQAKVKNSPDLYIEIVKTLKDDGRFVLNNYTFVFRYIALDDLPLDRNVMIRLRIKELNIKATYGSTSHAV